MLRNTTLDVPLETEPTKVDNLSSNMENLHSTNSLKMNALSSSMSEMSQNFNENTVLNTMHRDENNLIKNKGIVSSMKSYQQNTHSSSMAKNNDNTNNIAVPFSLSDVRCFGRISLKNSHLTSLKSDSNSEKENNLTINNTFMEGNTANVFNNFGNAEINSAHGSAEESEVDIRENSQSHKVYEPDVRDGLGPLPPKWETAYTERGELYFIDHNTGTSHWLDPRLSRFQKKSLEDCTEDELPYGWEKIEDSLYGTYYIDHVNRKTQYENPVLEAKRRAAERTKKNMHEQMEGNSATPLTTSSVLTGVASSSTASTVDIAQRNMHPPPPLNAYHKLYHPAYKFTRNPSEMRGERITTTLIKSFRGLGIKIVGGESLDGLEEFLQIKSIVPQGPAWQDNKLKPGDILVYVNDTCVLGLTHLEMVNIFQSIMPGDSVTLEICRGYPLPFDPNDPNTEVVTTIAVDSISSESANIHRTKSDHLNSMNKKIEAYNITINKGVMGFGFTIADSAEGQKVKKILDRNCCAQLQEGDILLQINETDVRFKTHNEVVRTLKECSNTEPAILKIQRNINDNDSIINEYSGDKFAYNFRELNKNVPSVTGLYRSKTPTADLYSTQQKEILPIRPKTPLVDTRRPRVNTPSNELSEDAEVAATIRNGNTVNLESNSDKMKSHVDRKSINSLDDIDVNNQYIPYMDPYPKLVSSLTERLANSKLQESPLSSVRGRFSNDLRNDSGHTAVYDVSKFPSTINAIGTINPQSLANHNFLNKPANSSYQRHHNDCFCYSCQDEQTAKNCNIPLIQQMPQRLFYGRNEFSSAGVNINQTHVQSPQYTSTSSVLQETQKRNDDMQKRVNDLLNDRRPLDFSTLENQNHHLHAYNPIEIQSGIPLQQLSPAISSVSQQPSINWRLSPNNNNLDIPHNTDQYELNEVTLERQSLGFGFRIVGGTEEGSQVAVGHIVPGGSADKHPHINTGDEILSIDGINVVNSSHHKVVSLMGEASLRGKVTMIVRRRIQEPYLTQTIPSASSIIQYPYDVIVSRHEHEGFGFVIISSSSQFYGSTIGKLIPESPADRCGTLKVGDRIVAVNCIEIAGMSHGDVVNLIKESGLHVRLTIGCPIKEFGTGSNSQEGTKSPSSLISTEPLQSNSHALSQLSQPKRDFPTSNNCATRNTLGDHQQKS